MNTKIILLSIVSAAILTMCGTKKNGEKRALNVFTLAQDRQLGA